MVAKILSPRQKKAAKEEEAARLLAEQKAKQAKEARRARRAERKRREQREAGEEEAPPVDSKALAVNTGPYKPPARMTEARHKLAEAFELMGGVGALVEWGKGNPTEFYRLWARLIPKEANVALTAMPLEDLLSKLASQGREGRSVAEAADAIGMEALREAQHIVDAEYLEVTPETLQ
jgi:hypothetical protein